MAPQFQARLAALAAHPLVGEARGLGLVGARRTGRRQGDQALVRSESGCRPARGRVRRSGGAARCASLAGDVMSLCPPLDHHAAEIDELFDRLGRALDRTLDWVTREGC